MAAPVESVIRCPRDLAENTPGFALDFGGSVVKIIYRSKEDAKELEQNKDSKYGNLRLITFTRENLTKGIEHLQQNCDLKQTEGKPTDIFTTGVGSTQYKTLIEKSLNVKMANVTEMDCFVKAFGYLREHLPAKDFVYEDLEDEFTIIEKENEISMAMMATMQNDSKAFHVEDFKNYPKWIRTNLSADEPLPESETFPCMLAMLGSAFGLMKLEKDGSFAILDMSNRGGRQFLGLGSILTGAKSYEELISLAEKGDVSSVCSTVNSFKGSKDADSSGDNPYGKALDAADIPDQVVFSFGNAHGKRTSDFKREDLAVALLHTMVLDLVQFISQNAELSGIRKVYMSGGFTVPPFVRKLFTQEFLRRSLNPIFGVTPGMTFHFLKQGQSLGTIGAYINNIDQFCKMPGQEPTA